MVCTLHGAYNIMISQDSYVDTDFLFVAQLDSVKSVLLILKAIYFKDTAICIVTDKGVKVTVEDSNCIQASAFIQAEMFQEYFVQEDQVIFKVPLGVLVECLSIFGGALTILKMRYQGYGHPLTLLLEEDGVITDCNIRTLEPENPVEFNFNADSDINKVIIKSEPLKEIFNDLDPTSGVLQIILSSDPPHLQFSTEGNAGDTQVNIPSHSEIFESFECNIVTSSRYQFSSVKSSFKSLAISERASIRIDENGLLCFQYMIPTDAETCFIEYYCMPLAED